MDKQKKSLKLKSDDVEMSDVTLAKKDNNEIQAHKTVLTTASTQICKYHNKGFCRYKTTCKNVHSTQSCRQNNCNSKTCLYRHPVDCRYKEKCKRKSECMYQHNRYELLELEINKLKVVIEEKDDRFEEYKVNSEQIIIELREDNIKFKSNSDKIINSEKLKYKNVVEEVNKLKEDILEYEKEKI